MPTGGGGAKPLVAHSLSPLIACQHKAYTLTLHWKMHVAYNVVFFSNKPFN